MKPRTVITTTALSLCAGAALACPPIDPESAGGPTPITAPLAQRPVDLVICLDTSGSMQGLIEAAKIKLWDIVNDLALAKPAPRLRVALLTYGNDGHDAAQGWVNIDAPFTEDLDLISQKLFALSTNGGTELVARVLKTAHEKLQWSPASTGDSPLQLIVVAGNESADQDRECNYRDVCKAIISRGVMVNSIYCGNLADDIAPGWKEVATLADGHFAAIDHNNGTIVISTPFDNDLATLSGSINETYVAFGAMGRAARENQAEQDKNAAGLGQAVAAQRCVTKGGVAYNSCQWDLVDACKQADFKLETVKEEDLPEAMRAMSVQERQEYVQQMQARRSELQARIAELNIKRQQFVADEMRKLADSGDKSFDLAIRKAIRAQALSKGFTFEAPAAPAASAAPQEGPSAGS